MIKRSSIEMGYFRWVLPTLLAVTIAFITGCRSTGKNNPKSSSHAWVVVPATKLETMQDAITSVFQEELYETTQTSLTQLVFEKPGSRMDGITYGSWFNSDVWTRVKVNIKPYQADSYLIESDLYMVRHRGDSFFEEETRAIRFKKKPFRQQLERVKKRIEAAPRPRFPEE